MEARNKHKGNNPYTAKRYNLSQALVLGAIRKESPLAPAVRIGTHTLIRGWE
jgi:soluble lytic murein transglycosylase-like protein